MLQVAAPSKHPHTKEHRATQQSLHYVLVSISKESESKRRSKKGCNDKNLGDLFVVMMSQLPCLSKVADSPQQRCNDDSLMKVNEQHHQWHGK